MFERNNVDEEDKLAEKAYDYCEMRMDERRKKEREIKAEKEVEKQKKSRLNIPISEQFSDLKRELGRLT